MKNLSTHSDKSSLAGTVNYVKDLVFSGGKAQAGTGLGAGVGALLSKTVLRGLPTPLRFVVPIVAEQIIVKHGVPQGREWLLQGLRWVKKVTDDKPAETHIAG